MLESNIDSRSTRLHSRRLAREFALKVSYAKEMRECGTEEIIADEMVTGGMMPPAFTIRLLSHMERYQENLDEIIRQKVHRWEFHRITLIDKIILRLGAAELIYFPDIPPKVAINEAIEIAKKYSTAQSSRFVNGILDAIFSEITKGKLVNENNTNLSRS